MTIKEIRQIFDKLTSLKKSENNNKLVNQHYHTVDEVYDYCDQNMITRKELEDLLNKHSEDFCKDTIYGWGYRKIFKNE